MGKKKVVKTIVRRVVPKTIAEAEQLSGNKDVKVSTGVDLALGSPQQIAIWKYLMEQPGNLLVIARAGTGKTYTMIEALKFLKSAGKLPKYTTFAAFNRAIGNELKLKVPEGVRAGTLHSLGFSACKYAWPDAKPDEDKLYEILMSEFGGQPKKADRAIMAGVLRLASLVKNCLLGEVYQEDGHWFFEIVPELLTELCERFDVDVEDDRPRAYRLVQTIIEQGLQDESTFDLDDMIWLPVVKGLRVFKSDLLIVDEVQDLNACQHAFVMMAGRRIVVVGDDFQSINGFRGADTESIPKLRTALAEARYGSGELTLTTSWRLPKSHAVYVQDVVKDIEAAPEAVEGVIADKHHMEMRKEVRPGDMVVCRTNAPLVSLAFWLIRHTKTPVKVQGRDIGANLIRLIDSLVDTDNITAFGINLRAYYEMKQAKLMKKDTQKNQRALMTLRDTYAMLKEFLENFNSIAEIKREINSLFASPTENDASRYVRLGSVHQVKGLEAHTVWVYGPEQMPHPMARSKEDRQQEQNIWYVAHSRSKQNMYLVNLPDPDEVET